MYQNCIKLWGDGIFGGHVVEGGVGGLAGDFGDGILILLLALEVFIFDGGVALEEFVVGELPLIAGLDNGIGAGGIDLFEVEHHIFEGFD